MPNSPMRQAFYDACGGAMKQIGMESFDCGPEAAASKMSRTLGTDPNLRPTWELLDNVIRRGDPGPILQAIERLAGVRISWRHVRGDDLRAEALRGVEGLSQQLSMLQGLLERADELDREEVA